MHKNMAGCITQAPEAASSQLHLTSNTNNTSLLWYVNMWHDGYYLCIYFLLTAFIKENVLKSREHIFAEYLTFLDVFH